MITSSLETYGIQDGLYFLQLMKWAIIQYCWVRPLTTFAAVIMNWIGIYCEQSWSPRFGSVWVREADIKSNVPEPSHVDFDHCLSLSLSSNVLPDPVLPRDFQQDQAIQTPLAALLNQSHHFPHVLAKQFPQCSSVIQRDQGCKRLLSLIWDAQLIFGQTKYMTAEDINVGIAALLQTFEMV